MSKRPGEELQTAELLKKQKIGGATDLPTSSTTSKISYGSLKTASSTSSISYAALRKQQVSTMKPPAPRPPMQALPQSSATSLQTKQQPTPSTLQQQAAPQQQSVQIQSIQSLNAMSTSGNIQQRIASEIPSNSEPILKQVNLSQLADATKPMNGPERKNEGTEQVKLDEQPAVKMINQKSQQMQILERAKKLREEELRLKVLRQQAAVRKAVENTSKGGSSLVSQQSQQKPVPPTKEKLKKEKKPLTKYELEMEQLKKYALKKEIEKKKMEKILQLVKEGKIKLDEQKKPFEDQMRVDGKEIDVHLDEKGNLIDSKGNVVVIEQKKTLLKVNQQKKQEEKLRKMMRNARIQKQQFQNKKGGEKRKGEEIKEKTDEKRGTFIIKILPTIYQQI